MKRIIILLTAVALTVAMMTAAAVPAFAAGKSDHVEEGLTLTGSGNTSSHCSSHGATFGQFCV